MKETDVIDAILALMALGIVICYLRGFWRMVLVDKAFWKKGPVNSWMFAGYVLTTALLLMESVVQSQKPEVTRHFYIPLVGGLCGLVGVIAGYARKVAGKNKADKAAH